MNKDAPAPLIQPNPQLDAIKQAAADEKLSTTQKMLDKDTQDILRRYGTRNALAGVSIAAPLPTGA